MVVSEETTATSDYKAPKVLIIGAGIASLFMGIVLDKAGIDSEIFERAPVVEPLGMFLCFLLCLFCFVLCVCFVFLWFVCYFGIDFLPNNAGRGCTCPSGGGGDD